MSLFIPITKVDVAKRLVYGTLTEEVPDKTGEILDYETAKPAFAEWSQQFENASGGKSLGNVRAMHGAVAAGKFTDIAFDDTNKRISGVAKIVDDDEWEKVLEGVYTGFSIGGGYARRWPDKKHPGLMRYTPILTEVSLVDNPAVPTATFEVIKHDGTTECRKFGLIHKGGVAQEEADSEEKRTALLEGLVWLQQDMEGEKEAVDITPHIIALRCYLGDDTCQEETMKFVRDDTLLTKIDTLQKRITTLESQPMPAKGVLRAIGKGDDYSRTEEQDLTSLTPDQRVNELMKIALANPILL